MNEDVNRMKEGRGVEENGMDVGETALIYFKHFPRQIFLSVTGQKQRQPLVCVC